MPNFALDTIDGLPPHPNDPFYKLVMDGKCLFDEFCFAMEKAGNQIKALEKIQSIIVQIAQGNRVPTEWFKELKHRSKNDPYPDFEIKSKQLRIYLFEDEDEGKIIVLGELKKGKTQDKKIAQMRDIKLAYFASKG